MATIITGMKYSVTTHGAHMTRETCILGRGEVECAYTLYENPKDIFAQLAQGYALAGSGEMKSADINQMPLHRKYLLRCDPKMGIARGLFIQGIRDNSYPGIKSFSEVELLLGQYKMEMPLSLRARGLVDVFSGSTGLVKVLLDTMDDSALDFEV